MEAGQVRVMLAADGSPINVTRVVGDQVAAVIWQRPVSASDGPFTYVVEVAPQERQARPFSIVEFNQSLCRALGLEASRVGAIDIHISGGGVPTAVVTMPLLSTNGGAVEVEFTRQKFVLYPELEQMKSVHVTGAGKPFEVSKE